MKTTTHELSTYKDIALFSPIVVKLFRHHFDKSNKNLLI